MPWWFYIIFLPLLFTSIGYNIYFYRVFKLENIKTKFWKVLTSLIQLFIFAAMAYSAFIMKTQIEQQKDYNLNTLRPWVYLEPSKGLAFKGSILYFPFTYTNSGYSPAFEVYCVAIITLTSKYPEDEICEKLKGKVPFFIFPSQEHIGSKVEKDMKSLNNNLSTESSITKYMQENPIFFHTYLKYLDSDDNKYFFRASYGLKISINEEGNIITDIRFINSSVDSLSCKLHPVFFNLKKIGELLKAN